MQRLAENTHGSGLWDSELHWDDLEQDGDVRFDDIKAGMLSAMDHFDLGFHALSWWAFQPRSAGTKVAYEAGTAGNAAIVTENRACYAMTFPANTITRVSVTLK